jgi:hypothetical protein
MLKVSIVTIKRQTWVRRYRSRVTQLTSIACIDRKVRSNIDTNIQRITVKLRVSITCSTFRIVIGNVISRGIYSRDSRSHCRSSNGWSSWWKSWWDVGRLASCANGFVISLTIHIDIIHYTCFAVRSAYGCCTITIAVIVGIHHRIVGLRRRTIVFWYTQTIRLTSKVGESARAIRVRHSIVLSDKVTIRILKSNCCYTTFDSRSAPRWTRTRGIKTSSIWT